MNDHSNNNGNSNERRMVVNGHERLESLFQKWVSKRSRYGNVHRTKDQLFIRFYELYQVVYECDYKFQKKSLKIRIK